MRANMCAARADMCATCADTWTHPGTRGGHRATRGDTWGTLTVPPDDSCLSVHKSDWLSLCGHK